MNVVFEKLTQIIGAGGRLDLGIAGDNLRLSDCTWPVTVILLKGGRVIGQMANMLAGDYVQGVEFDMVQILNGATAQAIDVQISAGGAGSNRVLGEVSVINGEIQRVKSGQVFIAAPWCGAVAGQYSHVELWNPAGSGVNVVLSKLSAYSTAGGAFAVLVNAHTAALAALYGMGANKMVGGAGSVAELRTANSAGIAGSGMGQFAIDAIMRSQDYSFSEPLLIPPGNGVVAVCSPVNQVLSTTYQWYEEPI